MSQLIPALPGLIAIGLGTGLLALFGRDPKTNDANQHDISDYHEPTQLRRDWNGLDWNKVADTYTADDILPPAPPGTNAGGSPIHAALIAEQIVAEQLRKWGATTAERAHRILRELGDKAQMEASIDPVSGHAVCWDGTCELGCPACADEQVTR